MKLLRHGFSGGTRVFLNFYFAEVLFTCDFPGLSETFPLDYFFVSIALAKVGLRFINNSLRSGVSRHTRIVIEYNEDLSDLFEDCLAQPLWKYFKHSYYTSSNRAIKQLLWDIIKSMEFLILLAPIL